VNDYAYTGTQNASMIGVDHALYRLGVRDRTVIQTLQSIALVLMGATLASISLGARLPRPAVCSLTALYSVLFFYHRIYDTVLLVLPLVYGVCRSQTAGGRSRWWFGASAIAVLLVLFANPKGMAVLTDLAPGWGLPGRLVQAIVLPYATWMVLLAAAGIYFGEACLLRPASNRTCGASCTASCD
jgi:hypothetical protein